MADESREALITGIGIISCLGDGADAHWEALCKGRSGVDAVTFAPYIVHPLAPIEFDRQIPKKGDQRQMEAWQRIGTYAAGLALDSAGIKGKAELLQRMDLIVAASGGERDLAVDSAILTGMMSAADRGAFLNEKLMSGLRPTLFLAQLSNLLAGNISIVHGVIGSSRTFMGEEAAGVDAIRVAVARIRAGQSDVALVGGAYNAERKDLLLLYEAGGLALKDQFAPVFARRERGGGIALGSVGAFLVIEAAEHAQGRGMRGLARLRRVLSDRSARRPGDVKAALERMWGAVEPNLVPGHVAVISGATGAEAATSEERGFLEARNGIPVRATASRLGHGVEAQFPLNVALAALAIAHGRPYDSTDESGLEGTMQGELRQVVVTSVGQWRGEGMALVEAPSWEAP
jgi:3-oxoacyl-[acyl-carrier-protein] synthase II